MSSSPNASDRGGAGDCLAQIVAAACGVSDAPDGCIALSRWTSEHKHSRVMGVDILFALNVALGVILLWASAQKLRTPRQFISGVERYRLVPWFLVLPAGVAVLVAEMATGALLITHLAPKLAASMAIGLFTLFSSVLAIGLVRKSDAPCFCFGAEHAEPISLTSFVRACLLLTLSALAALIAFRHDGPITGVAVPAALTLSTGLVVATRLIGTAPYAFRAFRTRPYIAPTRSPRMSFRNESLEFSLKQAVAYRQGKT